METESRLMGIAELNVAPFTVRSLSSEVQRSTVPFRRVNVNRSAIKN